MGLSRSWARVAARLRALFHGAALDRELDAELQFHLDHLVDENLARGLTPEAARRQALLAIGGVEQRKEECRDTRRVRLIEELIQDLRYAARTLRRSPAFAAAAIATLALGIGATVATFTVVNGVLLRPLPFPQPERLFLVALSPKSFFMTQPGMADGTYLNFRERDRTFQHLATFSAYKANLTGAGEPAVLQVSNVTTEFFDALGVSAAIGRTFLRSEGTDGREKTVVLSDQLWRSRFGANVAIVGHAILLNGVAHIVVGVMPPGFDFPGRMAAWTPTTVKLTPGNSLLVPVLGRLAPDVTIEQARAAFETTLAAMPDAPQDRSKWDVGLIPLKELFVGKVRTPLQIFAGAVLIVLLIACANVASLLLARASARDREVVVRAALGASRRRLVRQLLTESLLLSAAGATLGVLVARWMVTVVLGLAPSGRIPRADTIGVDIVALAFAVGLSAVAAILFGLAPALRVTHARSERVLVPAPRTVTGGNDRFRAVLVVAEIALALLLLTGAGLLMKSFARLRAVDSGFRTDNVIRLSVELPPSTYPGAEHLHTFDRSMLEGLRAVPNVVSAGLINWLPLGDMQLQGDFAIEGGGAPRFNVTKAAISGGYFQAMGIRLLHGREFDDTDTPTSQPVVIVSRTVANAITGSDDAVGKRVSVWGRAGAPNWLTVVGVVDDVRQMGPTQKLQPAAYQPYEQVRSADFLSAVTFLVRTSSDAAAAVPAVRQVLHNVDKNQPAAAIGLMKDVIDAATAEPAFYARLLTIFAALALALALIGTYGVIAYSVAQRSREIGLRMALGARGTDVLAMVLNRTAVLAAAGVVIGTGAAWAATRLLTTFLFEIEPTDPATFAAGASLIFAAAMAAGAVPARRATRVDPLLALRHE